MQLVILAPGPFVHRRMRRRTLISEYDRLNFGVPVVEIYAFPQKIPEIRGYRIRKELAFGGEIDGVVTGMART